MVVCFPLFELQKDINLKEHSTFIGDIKGLLIK